MSNVVRKNLGPVTAYKYAVSKGFEGTEQEFAALMASYATVAQEAEAAKDDAVIAQQAAEEAQAAAEAAASQAEGAITVDNTLSIEGRAADAKVTGDKIGSINERFGLLANRIQMSDWGTEIGVANYPLGWRIGIWNNEGSRESNSMYMMTAAKIRNFKTDKYPDFLSGISFVKVNIPDGYFFRVKEYTEGNLTQNLTLYNGDYFNVSKNDCLYGMHLGRFENQDAESYITEEFISQIVLTLFNSMPDKTLSQSGESADAKVTGDRLDKLNNRLPTMPFLWTDFASSSKPTGWQIGSYGSNGAYAQGNGNAMCVAGKLDSSNFKGVVAIKINYPGDYSFSLKTWERSNPTTFYERIDTVSGATIEIDDSKDLLYSLQLIGFGTEAQSFIDDGYTEEIVVTKIMRCSSVFKQKVTEFQRFTVINDRSWGSIGIGTVGNVEPQNLVETKCIIALPDTYTPNKKPVPLIMFCHGASGYITDTSWYGNSANMLTMIRAFTNAGFAVFDVDNTMGQEGGFADWGCLPLMTAYIKAWDYIKKHYNVREDLFLVSDSMGTLTSLNMLKWYGNSIKTAIQIAPRPICKHRYATQTDEKKKEMLVAFGIEDESILEDETFVIPDDSVFTDDYKGFYHWENIVEVGGINIIPNFMIPPIKVIVGAADTQFLTEVREYYTALRNSGNYVDYREVAGAGHNISFLPNYNGLTEEAVNWLKRFLD